MLAPDGSPHLFDAVAALNSMSDRAAPPSAGGKDKANECKQMLSWLFEKKPDAAGAFYMQLFHLFSQLQQTASLAVPASNGAAPATGMSPAPTASTASVSASTSAAAGQEQVAIFAFCLV
jgi:hypothetical protein